MSGFPQPLPPWDPNYQGVIRSARTAQLQPARTNATPDTTGSDSIAAGVRARRRGGDDTAATPSVTVRDGHRANDDMPPHRAQPAPLHTVVRRLSPEQGAEVQTVARELIYGPMAVPPPMPTAPPLPLLHRGYGLA
ncbi:hypothetical protein MN608_03171 [Microdochium nivale]|nr:hypothetical protein MN608_03171 [Microdochium nivale]